MFSNVGWGEILVIFILGLILIGPERLPKVIEDIRAFILAARTAINDARDNISGEFGEEFDDLRKPLQDLGDLRKLNPKTAITRTLFDNDDTYLDMLSGRPAAGGGADTPQAQSATPHGAQQPVQQQYQAPVQQPNQQPASYQPPAAQPSVRNWADDDVL